MVSRQLPLGCSLNRFWDNIVQRRLDSARLVDLDFTRTYIYRRFIHIVCLFSSVIISFTKIFIFDPFYSMYSTSVMRSGVVHDGSGLVPKNSTTTLAPVKEPY